MKVFISWSGEKSKAVAEYLKKWLEQVIQFAEPWISIDMDKGKKWTVEISQGLEESKVGVFCVTMDNSTAPWMLFEAGAIAKYKDSYVCTFLIDIEPTDILGPLSIFQATKNNKEDIYRLLQTINQTIQKQEGKSVSNENLKSLFDVFYPKLEAEINAILQSNTLKKEKVRRSDRELIEEAVQILRLLKSQQTEPLVNSKKLLDFYAMKYAKMVGGISSLDVGTDKYVNDFLKYISDNPVLLEEFGSVNNLKEFIISKYDGLPF